MPEAGHCPSCHGPPPDDATFCPHCGRQILAGSFAPRTASAEPEGLVARRPRGSASWPDLRKVFWFYAFTLFLSLVTSLVLQAIPNRRLELLWWVPWIVAILIYSVLEWKSVARSFRFRLPGPRTSLRVLFACALVVLFLEGYFLALKQIAWPMTEVARRYLVDGWPLWAVLGSIGLLPGITEEWAFRGLIQTKLGEILSKREALIVQAALFSVLHLSPIIFVSHFAMGLLLGWVRLQVGHVYVGMVLHAAWNMAVVLREINSR